MNWSTQLWQSKMLSKSCLLMMWTKLLKEVLMTFLLVYGAFHADMKYKV